VATKVANGLDLQAQRILAVGDPSGAQDAATKSYVDSVARGLDWKNSARAASTGNLNLASPGATIDGVTMAANDRFLAKDQTTGSQNGIYTWNGAAVAATRVIDADTSAEVTSGMAVSVTEGTANGDKTFVLTTNDPITLDTTALVFAQLGGSGSSYIAGNGLTLTGTTFDVGAGTGITVAADSVAIDTAVVMRRFAANIGNGAATAITVTHGFGTRDVSVDVYTNATPWDDVICDVTRPNVNDVTITFATAPASGAYRVVIIG
jgi:hypothetical protein